MALPRASELPIGPTQAAKEMNPLTAQPHTANVKLLTSGEVYEDRPEGYDFSHVTAKEMRAMGLNPDTHEVCLIRNPAIWENLEKKDRIREFLSVGGRVVPLQDGEPIAVGDLIYAAKSKEEIEARRRAEESDGKAYQEGIKGGDLGDQSRYRAGKTDADAAYKEHARNVADGVIGPTGGRDFMDVIRDNPDRFKRDQEWFRTGGKGSDVADEAAAARIDEMRNMLQKPRNTGGKFISIPDNVKPKNLMKR